MKILVIGNGFIATAILQRLHSEGHELLVFSRRLNEKIQYQQIAGDIFDFEEFAKVFDWEPQIIIHTAWITTPGVYRNAISNLKYAQFTTDLAKYVAHSDVEHLIILGTCSEYGHRDRPSTAGITSLSPRTLYAEQKVVALNSAKELLQNSHVRFTWPRIFYPYGPNQDQKRLIPHLIRSIENGEPIILNDTSSIHDWITTRDIASAISWVMENDMPTEIDVGTSVGFTNLELLVTIEELLQSTNQATLREIHNLGQNEIFVAGKTSPLFISGWSPTDSLITGLEWVLSQ